MIGVKGPHHCGKAPKFVVIDEVFTKEAKSNLVKNQFLREDLRKVARDWQVPKIMKILKDHGLVSGD